MSEFSSPPIAGALALKQPLLRDVAARLDPSFNTASTMPVNVSGLSISLVSGVWYRVSGVFQGTATGGDSGSIDFAGGTATVTSAGLPQSSGAFRTGPGDDTAFSGGDPILVDFICQCTASGTLIPRVNCLSGDEGQGAGLAAGSFWQAEELNI